MTKNVELKEGIVIGFEGQSYLILNTFGYIELDVKPISCDCGGNLMKFGRVKGQYRCLKCDKPVYLNENGERIE